MDHQPTRPTGLQRRLQLLNTTRQVIGSWQALRLAGLQLLNRPQRDGFDLEHGTDTREAVDPRDAQLPAGSAMEGAEKYAPTHPRVLRHVLENLEVDYQGTTFVDIGCGKGRGVLMATGLPFRRIRGIELSPITSDIARKNVEIFLGRQGSELACRDVEVLNQNALAFPLPSDSDVAFYLFHPFNSDVLGEFVEHVCAEMRETGTRHRVRMAYSMLLPESARVLDESPFVRKTREVETLSGIHSWSLWEFEPGAAGA